ncbi:phage tail domain-containing protein [uncultured Limosilactobacillus sp.]|uniref:phage tail domain-containing protein n=1 Tax=uncultured Limosilactobacillus sp. TaxID=2837629 RepID=UPI0025F2E05C|nr:phage tail domain-containing protein [uncultured Limosilactobacillus sp.]
MQVFSLRKDKPRAYPFLHARDVGIGAKTYLAFDPVEFSIAADGKGENWHSIFDVPDLDGVYCYRAPDVQPATITNNTKKVGLADGSMLVSTTYDSRDFTVEFLFEGLNEDDAMLAWDALQRFIVARDPYWICFANWPQRMYFVKAKLAKPAFSNDRAWTCEVTFTDLIGLSRSVGTTADWDNAVIGFGNNEPTTKPQYSFTGSSFTVVNSSDILVDPERRHHPFKMTMKGSSNGEMKITNQTTGEVFHKKSAFNGIEELNLVNVTFNGKNDFLDIYDDQNAISLQKGENKFTVENFSGTISFDFAMWWLS